MAEKAFRSGAIGPTSSSSVMPQMEAYSGAIEMFWMLLSSEKIESWLNLVMPVRNTKRRYSSHALRGA